MQPLGLELSVRLAALGSPTIPEMIGGSVFQIGCDTGIGWTGEMEEDSGNLKRPILEVRESPTSQSRI